VDETLPFAQMTLEEEQPLVEFIAIGLLMALALLFPAVVHAAWRGCLAARNYFAVDRVARFRDGSGSPARPWVLESPIAGRRRPWS
jgi:hypothetical protein